MAKQNYYAVRKGRIPGIYLTWDDASKQVHGFEGAVFKKFPTIAEAAVFMEAPVSDSPKKSPVSYKKSKKVSKRSVDLPEGPYAFVDGSFNAQTGVYGYGGFLTVNEDKYPLQGRGSDPEMAKMRNVSGEIAGAMAAVEKAEELGLKELTLLYDYKGIEAWVHGFPEKGERQWVRNKQGTRDYADFMNSPDRSVQVHFKKVPAHTGIEGNEMADVMAKDMVGISLTKKEQLLLDDIRSQVHVDDLIAVNFENTDDMLKGEDDYDY